MKDYSNDAIKLKIIEFSHWRMDAQATYKVFIETLKDMNFWFMLAQKRQLHLTEQQLARLDWATHFLTNEAESKAFFKKRKAELAFNQALETV
jgi:hypothetical protein